MQARDALLNIKPLVFDDEWSAIDELRLLAAAGEVRTASAAIRRHRGNEHSFSVPGPLEEKFWTGLNLHQGEADSVEEWQAGRFRYRTADAEIVEASGVQFCAEDLQRWLRRFGAVLLEQQSGEAKTPTRRGRRPANWWPDALEEALVDYYENGWPEGEDTNGIETVIDRLLTRMAAKGIEPSRASLQGPIRRALLRCRSTD